MTPTLSVLKPLKVSWRWVTTPRAKVLWPVSACAALLILDMVFHVPEADWLMAGGLVAWTAHYLWRGRRGKPVAAEMIEEHTLFEAVLNTVPHALYVKDLEQRVVLVNKATELMAGLPAKDLIGHHIAVLSRATVLPDEQLRQVLETDQEVAETGKTAEFMIHRAFPEGDRQMRVTKSPVRNRDGKITGMLLMAEDITAKLKTEQEIQEQRTLLRTVFDAIPHFLYVKDREDRFILANRAMELFQPQGSPSLIGQQVMLNDLREDAEKQRVRETNRRVIEDGVALDFHRAIGVQGFGNRHLRTIKVPLRNAEGDIVGLVGMDEDETQRVDAEQQVLEQREFLQAVLDAIPQDLFVKDKDGRTIMVNQAMANRWGKPKIELLGQRGYGQRGVTDADLRRIEDSDRRVLEEGVTHTWVQDLTDASGMTGTFRVNKVPLRNQAGVVTGLVMTGEDVSALAASQQELANNRSLLRTVLDAIPETVSLKDTSLRYQFVNHAAPGRLGLSPTELVGKTVDDLPLMTDAGKVDSRAADEYVLASGNATTVPLVKWTSMQGGDRWERVLKQPVRDDNGKVTGIVTIGEDVTDLVTAQQDAERSRRLLQTILDTLPAGIFVKDTERRYTLVNRPFAARYGVTPADIVGNRVEELKYRSDEDRKRAFDQDERVLKEGIRIDTPPVRGPQREGAPPIWERVIKVPLRNANGTITNVVGLTENITELVKAEEERMALSRLMQRTQNLESLGVMAAGIAHEFNNVLQRILGHTELVLAELPAGGRMRGDVEMIQQAGRTAVSLTNQMVALSGRSRFKVEPVQLNRIVESMLAEVRSLLPNGVVLSHHLGGPALMALADEPLLQQVIVSLVINATEALQKAGDHVRLEVGVTQVDADMLVDHAYSDRTLPPGPYAYVEVRDNGPGIPRDILERLYEPFFSTKFIGRGLGLSAVRGIVHGHHGALHVRSKEGEGTSFRVLLPIAEANAAPAGGR